MWRVASALGVLLVVPACGGDDGTEASGSEATETTETTATTATTAPPQQASAPAVGGKDNTIKAGDLFFEPEQLTVPAGEVGFTLVNVGVQPHTLKIDDPKLYLAVAIEGDKETGSVTLAPGTYQMYCDIPGHQAAGMEAQLTVQ